MIMLGYSSRITIIIQDNGYRSLNMQPLEEVREFGFLPTMSWQKCRK